MRFAVKEWALFRHERIVRAIGPSANVDLERGFHLWKILALAEKVCI
jgi:hypothetical protein